MRKTVLTTACATLIALGSIAAASAQTGTTNASGNATISKSDSNMNAMNKMKKKKMMKKGMMKEDGMDKGGMSKGGMEKKM